MLDTCKTCGEEKEAPSEFVVNLTAKRGYTQKCKSCYNSNRVRHDYEHKCNRLRPYGLKPEDYDRMFEEQVGVCAICGEESDGVLSVDHCHKTKKVRGLLCKHCNFGIGHFMDDKDRLHRAIKYLKEN